MEELLFLVHRIPFPPNKGDKIRSWHMLEQLARTHRVRLGCLIDDPFDYQYVEKLESVCAEVAAFDVSPRLQRIKSFLRARPGVPLTLGYFRHPGLAAWVQQTIRTHDIRKAFIFSSAMAPYVAQQPGMTRILDMVDVDSLKWRDLARKSAWPLSQIYAREYRTLLDYEKRLAVAADETIFVSEAEMRRFLELAPDLGSRVTWMSNGVDHQYFDPSRAYENPYAAEGRHLVFTGAMDYAPNVDAVVWFTEHVMPILRRRGVAPHFWIVGANPSAQVRALQTVDIHVVGRVPDMRPFIRYADVVVAPLRIARGIQNKVLEGMAMGRIVVATPQAREGIEAEHGRELLLAESHEGFASLIEQALDGRHAGLGPAARTAIVERYDWGERLKGLGTFLARAA